MPVNLHYRPAFAPRRLYLLALLAAIIAGCASPVMLATTDENAAGHRISPAQAVRLATPHLQAIFRLRCERRMDKHWCEKPTREHVVLLGDYYHVTRESYPYKTIQAYLEPSVRVHRDTGKLVLPENEK